MNLCASKWGPALLGAALLVVSPALAQESMTEFITEGSEYGKPYGVRGVGGDEGGGMPGFGPQDADDADGQRDTKGVLTQEQIEAIVEYERSLEADE